MTANGVPTENDDAIGFGTDPSDPITLKENVLLITEPEKADSPAARVILYYYKDSILRKGEVKDPARVIALIPRCLPRGQDVYIDGNSRAVGRTNCCGLTPRVFARVDLEPDVYPDALSTLPSRIIFDQSDLQHIPHVFHAEPVFVVNGPTDEPIGYIQAANVEVRLKFADADSDFAEKHPGLHVAQVGALAGTLLGNLIRNDAGQLIGAVIAENVDQQTAIISSLPDVTDIPNIDELDGARLNELQGKNIDPLDAIDIDDEDEEDDE